MRKLRKSIAASPSYGSHTRPIVIYNESLTKQQKRLSLTAILKYTEAGARNGLT
jgi:hypothetical protein